MEAADLMTNEDKVNDSFHQKDGSLIILVNFVQYFVIMVMSIKHKDDADAAESECERDGAKLKNFWLTKNLSLI